MPNGYDSPFLHTAERIYSQSPGGPMEDLARAQIYAQIQQAQFMLPIELERKQRLGEIQAQLAGKEWEAKYTAQHKADIARKYNGLRMMKKSGRFTPEQMTWATNRVFGDILMDDPDFFPKTEQQKIIESLSEQKRGPYDPPWKGEDGGWYKTEVDKDGNINYRITVRPDQTLEAIRMKAEQELQKEIREFRQKLATEEITVQTQKAKPGGFLGIGKEKPEYEMRRRRPEEVEAIIQNVYGMNQQLQQQQPQQTLPVVRTDADYEALPSGTIFIDENGRRYQKPYAFQPELEPRREE